jgi:hypothetical protein
MTELEALIFKAGQGEQNRYGDIEYTYSENERCKFLTQISLLFNHIDPNQNEQEKISSLLYWSLLGTSEIIQVVVVNFLPWMKLPCVKQGFFIFFEENNTDESKLRYAHMLVTRIRLLPKSQMRSSFEDELLKKLNNIDQQELNQIEREAMRRLIGSILN